MLILVDGIPTNATGTPFLILNEVPLDAIQQVEVVKGPYSSLYGANAFSGVINVITTDGAGKPSVQGDLETSMPFNTAYYYYAKDPLHGQQLWDKGASDALYNATGTSSGAVGKLSYLVSGGYRTIGNYMLRDSTPVRSGESQYRKPGENHDYQTRGFSAREHGRLLIT